MEITKCYKIGDHIIIDPLQLIYLNKLYKRKYAKSIFQYEMMPTYFKKNYQEDVKNLSKQMKAINQAIEKGLSDKRLVSLKELKKLNGKSRFPDKVIETKDGVFYFKNEKHYVLNEAEKYIEFVSEEDVENNTPKVPTVSNLISVKKEENNYVFEFETKDKRSKDRWKFEVTLENNVCWCINTIGSNSSSNIGLYVYFTIWNGNARYFSDFSL